MNDKLAEMLIQELKGIKHALQIHNELIKNG